MKCKICGNSNVNDFLTCGDADFANKKVNLYKCDNCKVAFVHPMPSQRELGKYYFSTYYDKPSLLTNFIQFLRKRRFSNLKPGKLLDVGCGSGDFLLAMSPEGWDCHGTEISKSSDGFLNNFHRAGIKIRKCFLPNANFKNNYFDLVTMWHVLEHLYDPKEYLLYIKKILKSNGYLMIAVPNMESIGFKIWKCNWFQLDVPRHLFHFSPESLTKLLHQCGYEIASINHYSFEFNPFTILQSFYNCIGLEYNFLHRILKNSNKTAGIKFHFNMFFTVITLPFFAAIAIPLAYIFSFLGKGETIEFIAKKA